MNNLDKPAKLLAKIVNQPGGGAEDCALMRLARANEAGPGVAEHYYPILAKALEGLTDSQVNATAYGWDDECGRPSAQVACTRYAAEVAKCTTEAPEYEELGRAAARALGLAKTKEPARNLLAEWEKIARDAVESGKAVVTDPAGLVPA